MRDFGRLILECCKEREREREQEFVLQKNQQKQDQYQLQGIWQLYRYINCQVNGNR